jgi:transcriptional regulator with XRE-family HTH domain
MVFANNLNRLMQEKAMSVRQAAQAAQVSPSTLQAWRAGAHPTDFAAVRRLARALGVSMTYLLTGEEENTKDHDTVIVVDDGLLYDGIVHLTVRKLSPQPGKRIVWTDGDEARSIEDS